MLEVLDNFPHDLIYSEDQVSPWKEVWVEKKHDGEMPSELYKPLQEPLIKRCIEIIDLEKKQESSALLKAKSMWSKVFPKPRRCWLPTGCLKLLDVLHGALPKMSLIASDFSYLPDVKILGERAPLVSTKGIYYRRQMSQFSRGSGWGTSSRGGPYSRGRGRKDYSFPKLTDSRSFTNSPPPSREKRSEPAEMVDYLSTGKSQESFSAALKEPILPDIKKTLEEQIIILQKRDERYCNSPNTLTKRYFEPEVNFPLFDQKNRKYYEYILIETDSGDVDIFFPTEFWLLERIDHYCSGWQKAQKDVSSKEGKKRRTITLDTSSFMEELGLPSKTRTKDGYNPLLDDFKNTKFYSSVPTHNTIESW